MGFVVAVVETLDGMCDFFIHARGHIPDGHVVTGIAPKCVFLRL